MRKKYLTGILLISALLIVGGCKSGGVSPLPGGQSSVAVSETSQASVNESTAESSGETPQKSSATESSASEPDESSDISEPESLPSEISEVSRHEESSEVSSEASHRPVIGFPDEDITTVDRIEYKYFVNKLSSSQKKSFAVLYHAAASFEEKAIFHTNIKEEDLDELMWLLNYDCPELIHLKGDYSPIYENDEVKGIKFFYNMSKDVYRSCMDELDGFFSSLKSETAGMSDYEKEKYVYDLLFDRLVYTEQTERSGSAYGALIENKARCEGISKGFAWCMNELGIDCMAISGYPLWENNGMFSTHSWNIITIGGKYYHVDLTADDLRESEYQMAVPLYSFLNQEDAIISKTHLPLEMYRQLGIPSCTSDDLNYHVMNDLVITSDDDIGLRLNELLDRFYSPDGKVYIPIRFLASGTYESFIDVWEDHYNEYLTEKGLDYRWATLYHNDVGKTVAIYIEDDTESW